MLEICRIQHALLAICLFAFTGCSQTGANNVDHVFVVVIEHLAEQDLQLGRFTGERVWVSPEFAIGDSLGLSWGSEFKIEEELVQSLRQVSSASVAFPSPGQLGSDVLVAKIDSFNDRYYSRESSGNVDAKCLVQFWKPGFSRDKKRCVVRFWFGPSPHGAAGTYILELKKGAWEIIDSTISYYA